MLLNVPPGAAAACAAAAAMPALMSEAAAARQSAAGSRNGQGPHVRVELITDRATPAPEMRFGLKFSLDPGWHVCWQNPGDSGGPPEASWTLPPGMRPAGIEWPAPGRIDAGGLVDYGYHHAVVLPVAVAIAAGARIPQKFIARASLRWMACADFCVPGAADLALAFPLGADALTQVSGWKTAIDAARRAVPKPAPASWTASASSSGDTFVVEIITGSREEQAVFFPLELSQVNDTAGQSVSPLPNGLRLTLEKSSQLANDPAVLRGVLSLSGGRAFTIQASVR